MYVVRPETREGPQRTLHRELLLPCGYLPITPAGSETNRPKAVRRPRTQQQFKNDSSDGDETPSDSDEYSHYGHRDLRVETLIFNFIPELEECSSERIEPEPTKKLSAVERDPSDVAKYFPEDPPVDTCDPILSDPEDEHLPDPEKKNLPDEQETGNLPEEDLEIVDACTQPAHESKGNMSVTDQTDIQAEQYCSRRSTRDRKVTKRLTYPELGNLLVTIVQSLLQSLSEVLTDSLEETSFPNPPDLRQNRLRMHRDMH